MADIAASVLARLKNKAQITVVNNEKVYNNRTTSMGNAQRF